MTPTRRPAATAGRLLAHGVGLGLLAGGVVLGAQGAAQALQYVFTGTTTDPGLQLSFRSPAGAIFGDRVTGTGSVTGSFNYDGGSSLSDISVTFTSDTGNTVTQTFTTGFYDTSNNRLVFGSTTATNCGSVFGPDPCLELELAGTLSNTPGEVVNFDTGLDQLGDYYDSDNDQAFLGGAPSQRRDLTFVSGTLLQIPAPLSALALLPLAGLKRYRRRFQRLSGDREAATSATEMG